MQGYQIVPLVHFQIKVTKYRSLSYICSLFGFSTIEILFVCWRLDVLKIFKPIRTKLVVLIYNFNNDYVLKMHKIGGLNKRDDSAIILLC